jgi:hypothetical protein
LPPRPERAPEFGEKHVRGDLKRGFSATPCPRGS